MITFFCQICENLKNDVFVIGIQSQSKCHHQVQDFSNDHVKLEFLNGVFYHDGLLYVPNCHAQFQVLQAKHDVLAIGHFKFNKTMKLMSQNY